MSDDNKPYDVLVHHPDGEGPTMRYTFKDLDLAIEGISNIALAHVKEHLGVRRLLEILPAQKEETGGTNVTGD